MDATALLAIHPLLADRVRLALMATLGSAEEPIDFSTLLEALELSKGNLSSHLRKLEEGNLISVEKSFVDRKPRTTYQSTEEGKNELNKYLLAVEKALKK